MSAADVLKPLVRSTMPASPAMRIECWDGSALGLPGPVTALGPRGSPTRWRSGCRTTARWPTGRSTPPRASAWPNTSGTPSSRHTRSTCGLLAPGGRLLNHAITRTSGPPPDRGRRSTSFIERHVFPDGELVTLADTVGALELGGLEVRDVQSLREHYALTLRAWMRNLEQH